MFRIFFPCAPENVDKLSETALNLVRELKEKGPSEADLHKIKEAQRRQHLENLKDNNYWLSALRNSYYLGMDPLELLKTEQLISNLSTEDIRKAASELVELDKYVKVVLYPEGYLQP
jgi:zinc protease